MVKHLLNARWGGIKQQGVGVNNVHSCIKTAAACSYKKFWLKIIGYCEEAQNPQAYLNPLCSQTLTNMVLTYYFSGFTNLLLHAHMQGIRINDMLII